VNAAYRGNNAPEGRRPNLLFILTDQQRQDSLGCYGNPVIETPHLDRLAAEGIRLENGFTCNGVCMPSRASLLTGRYPSAHRLITNGMPLAESEITLPTVLAGAGYATAAIGKLHLTPVAGLWGRCDEDSTYVSPESPEWHKAGFPMPRPYYGFQDVRVIVGHPGTWSHYWHDLLEIDPHLPELWSEDKALCEPSGAPSSWKAAIPEEHHTSTWIADQVIARLENYARKGRPFFLFAGFPDPHFPFCPPAPWCDHYSPADVPMPKRIPDEHVGKPSHYERRLKRFEESLGYHPYDMPDEHVREIIAHTYGMVSLIDKNVGRMLYALQRLGLRESTAIVFTSDHGEHLGDHWLIYKCAPYDEFHHVPLIWSWPGHFAEGTIQAGFASHVDVMPTILELAGVGPPRGVQGQSYARQLTDGSPIQCGQVLMEDDDEAGKGRLRTFRTERYRLSYYLPEREGELYDLESDPEEFANKWDDPAYRSVRGELFERAAAAMMQACDRKPERPFLF